MYSIRPLRPTPQDYAAIAAVTNAAWPDERPQKAEDLQMNDAEWPSHALNQHFVVEHDQDQAIVGEGSAYEPFWEHKPGVVHLSFSVHPDHEGKGVEELLYETLLAHVQQHIYPLTTLATDAREDRLDRMRFLEQRAFHPAMRSLKSGLQVAEFDSAPYAAIIARFTARQIGIHTLAVLQRSVPDWRERLYELRWAIMQDVPSGDPPTKMTMAEFENMIFGDPAFTPKAWFIAVDEAHMRASESGTVGPFVGMSNLWVNDPTYQQLDTGLTGVIRDYRRQGLATALKVRTIEFAKQHGCRIIVTSNEENNPMYGINQRLGFQPLLAWVSYRKAL